MSTESKRRLTWAEKSCLGIFVIAAIGAIIAGYPLSRTHFGQVAANELISLIESDPNTNQEVKLLYEGMDGSITMSIASADNIGPLDWIDPNDYLGSNYFLFPTIEDDNQAIMISFTNREDLGSGSLSSVSIIHREAEDGPYWEIFISKYDANGLISESRLPHVEEIPDNVFIFNKEYEEMLFVKPVYFDGTIQSFQIAPLDYNEPVLKTTDLPVPTP